MTGTIYIPLRHYLPSLQSFLEFHLNPEILNNLKLISDNKHVYFE